MLIASFCGPALIYFTFMLIHVMIFMYKNKTNEAILQLVVGILMTLLLQLLCMKGMSIISWIIVFIPFIFYTYMMILLFRAFGLDPDENMKQFLVT